MKWIKSLLLVLVCVLVSTGLTMAVTPGFQKNEKEKRALKQKIRRSVSKMLFARYLEVGSTEMIVLYCSVDESGKVVVSKVIGFNDKIKEAVRERIEQKEIMADSDLAGHEVALKFRFEMCER